MDAKDNVLALFDFYWIQTLILHRNLLPPRTSIVPAIAVDVCGTDSVSLEPSPPPPLPVLLLRRHRRSRSDDVDPFSALQIQPPKLQTILSGKIAAEKPHPMVPLAGACRERGFKQDQDRRLTNFRRKKGESKSLTDLEFEELKGFMDLGFSFSDAEAQDPRLVSIVPGLQRMRDFRDREDSAAESSSSASEEGAVPRAPYLSESWAAVGYHRANDFLRNWRIPTAGEGVDMKDHIRLWAHAVASTVR